MCHRNRTRTFVRTVKIGLILLSWVAVSMVAAQPFDPPDGVDLTLVPGPGAGEMSLSWTGGQPTFEVYRSPFAPGIEMPSNKLGETDLRDWLDVPPASDILYYRVTSPCQITGPEICDGTDNDCNGLIDDDCDQVFYCTPMGDYVEMDDAGNNLFEPASGSEATGLALQTGGPGFSLGGCVAPEFETLGVADADFFTFNIDGTEVVETRVELTSFLGDQTDELVVALYNTTDASYIDGGVFRTTHALIGNRDLAVGSYWLAVWGGLPAVAGPITYHVEVMENPYVCPLATGAPDYTEADESASGHRANDVVGITFGPFTVTETPAADSPEVTGVTAVAGASYLLEGLTAAVGSDGDEYLDRDSFTISTGPNATELHIVLNWPDGDVDMDMFLFALGDVTDIHGSATTIGTTDDEEIVAAVDPNRSYMLWVGTYDETGFGGDTDLPVTYDITLCAREFTP